MDMTVVDRAQMEVYEGEYALEGCRFIHAGKSLGLRAFGMNLIEMDPGFEQYPEHDHTADDQEEVYVLIEGSAALHAGGEVRELIPGRIARVGPSVRRKLIPGDRGAVVLAIGSPIGKPYPMPAGSR